MLPVGNAGNISAYWMGYREYAAAGVATRTPRMWGVQAEGAAPFVKGEPVENPETVATAIRIGNPASWALAVAARDESGGWIDAVTDAQILDAQALIAARGRGVRRAGVGRERRRAAAGRRARARCPTARQVACTVTGNGLKDTATALGDRPVEPRVIGADVADAARALGLAQALRRR